MKFIFKNFPNCLIIICWSLIVLSVIPYHELWYDEIIPYHLINTFDFVSLFKVLQGTEGHPPLWYLIQYPFVKSGFSINIIQYISFGLVFASVCYFCFRSRFNFLVKFLFLFSGGMLYLIPLIPRNYSIIPLFLFMLADIYHKRHTYPLVYALLLIILSQTHVLLWGFCIICSLIFIIEFIYNCLKQDREKLIPHIVSVFALILSFIITFFYFIFLISYHRNVVPNFDLHLISEFITFWPQQLGFSGFLYILFSLTIILFVVSLYLLDKKLSVIFISSLFAMEFIFIFVIEIGGVPLQKIFLLFLTVVFCAWIVIDKNGTAKKINNFSFYILLIIMFLNPFAYTVIKDEINNSFCNLSVLTDFFKGKLAKDEHILEIGSTIFYNKYLTYIDKNQLYNIEINDAPEILDNQFIENLNSEKDLNIKYVIIYDKINYNLDYPYKEIYKSQNNKVTSIEIFQPLENDFVIYEKIK